MENAIRPTAVGKKNWLFIGHPDAYLRDVLSRLPSMTNQDDIDALTPRLWLPVQPPAS